MYGSKHFIVVLGLLLNLQWARAIWTCSTDQECSSMSGSLCSAGTCVCPPGKQQVLGGTACVDIAPYFGSPCSEDFQCVRMFTAFECQIADGDTQSSCQCRPGHHYFHGRCWPSRDFGDDCTRDEECQNDLVNPFSMACNGTCVCADGHYLRQRGECRRIGYGVGDNCVLNEDCQFTNGVCDRSTLTCYDSTIGMLSSAARIQGTTAATKMAATNNMATRMHDITCSAATDCASPFECMLSAGVCVCPVGYYISDDGSGCLAELGSPATGEICTGLLAIVENGICTCPVNFYFDANMRDCVKATLRLSDSCVSDNMCHTFGVASVCGEPSPPWGMRSCECEPERSVFDQDREMCRLFVGIGEECEENSDCLAGNVEILCLPDAEEVRRCTCPEGLEAVGGLCITTGLELGDSCQVSQECTGTINTVCTNGFCSCSEGYQENNGTCSAVLGGACALDADCIIDNTVCLNNNGQSTCQCGSGFVEFEEECWPVSAGINSSCVITTQCTDALGEGSECYDGSCACSSTHHFRGGACWPRTGLFETCDRSSVCYLGDITDRVVCRNGLCQCDFDFPFSPELDTCVSSSSTILGNISIVIAALYLLLHK